MDKVVTQIVFLDAKTMNPGDLDLSSLHQVGKVTIYDQTSPEQLLSRAKDAEVLITNKCILDASIISQLPQLKYIQVAATGYNNIDIEACKQHGILVANVSGYSTTSVAQHVFAMLLNYHNSTATYVKESHNGVWPTKPWTYWHDPIEELAGKQLGIIGLGSIGKAVLQIAEAFGMHIVSPSRGEPKDVIESVTYLDWSTFLGTCDYLSLHCPLTEETHHLINANSLVKMKPTAVLINTSRGPVINEDDLHAALSQGIIKAALLDVLSEEPPSADNPLLNLANCHITPHQAWGSKQARERLLQGIVDNITKYNQGDNITDLTLTL